MKFTAGQHKGSSTEQYHRMPEVCQRATWHLTTLLRKCLCAGETKAEKLDKNNEHYVWYKNSSAYQHENIIPNDVWQGGGCGAHSMTE